MRLLVLGGTWFVGRTLVERALSRGWSVTTFSRGVSGHDVPGAELIRGDRTVPEDLARLAKHGPWDAVVDTSGQEPATVAASAATLADKIGRYTFISTVNVYQGWPDEPLTDSSPVLASRPDMCADDPDVIGLSGMVQYGVLKAGCEKAIQQSIPSDRVLILRPGVILGPYEYVGRLPWLLRRMQRGGRVLAAGDPQRAIQPVDARDLVNFTLDMVDQGQSGVMNVTAPVGHATYGEMMSTCRDVTGGHAELVWVTDDWLAAQDVRQWSEIPLWRTTRGAWAVTSDRAHQAGFTCRPLTDTITDTWAWLQDENPIPHERAAEMGLDPAKEVALLAAWDKASGRSAAGEGLRR